MPCTTIVPPIVRRDGAGSATAMNGPRLLQLQCGQTGENCARKPKVDWWCVMKSWMPAEDTALRSVFKNDGRGPTITDSNTFGSHSQQQFWQWHTTTDHTEQAWSTAVLSAGRWSDDRETAERWQLCNRRRQSGDREMTTLQRAGGRVTTHLRYTTRQQRRQQRRQSNDGRATTTTATAAATAERRRQSDDDNSDGRATAERRRRQRRRMHALHF